MHRIFYGVIGILILTAITIGINTEHSLRQIMSGVDVESTIAIARLTVVNIIATLLLVGVTFTYVRYTRKMAKGTLKIAALNERLWRHSAMPLFYPINLPELNFRPGTHYNIEIKNIGGIALLTEVSFSLTGFKGKYPKIDPHQVTTIKFQLPVQPKRVDDFKKSFTINISFHDKAAIRYTQILKYEFKENKWLFAFHKANLPKEIVS